LSETRALLGSTELDEIGLLELQETMARYEPGPDDGRPRRYPGYPTCELPAARPRLLARLDAALWRRRSVRDLAGGLPSRRRLGRLLQFAHGISGPPGCGPVPSAGGLQSVELYLVVLDPATWLPAGLYHYDRPGHHLSRIAGGARRDDWLAWVPSLHDVRGGSLLWVIAGDLGRTEAKYGERAHRLLLLEAGHLMQNLCLLSWSLGLSTVPSGGFLERAIQRVFLLPGTDAVLYVGVCGATGGNRPAW
jgi:SagB-type dehydrogenase family enzyme